MRSLRTIKTAFNSLLKQKLRTFLAILGVAIGVAAVIGMVAIGAGARQEVLKQLSQFGTNVLTVNASRKDVMVGRSAQTTAITSLKVRDAEAILENCPSVIKVAPLQDGARKVKYGNLFTQVGVLGSTVDLFPLKNYKLEKGRLFTEEENRAFIRVAIIGSQVKEVLFKEEDPIGETILVGRIPFEVIGLIESKGTTAEGSNEDNQIIIPLSTALRRVFNLNYIKRIFVQVASSDHFEEAEAEIGEELRKLHRLDRRNKPDDFTIDNQLKSVLVEEETTQTFTFLTIGIASIALFVGGIGILAVMLLSIRERTNEIGLRMAIGAKPRDITFQFLTEAMILGSFGGFLGVAMGILATILTAKYSEWNAVISPAAILVSCIFSILVGLIFGVYPARKASKLDPIEALNDE